MFSGFLQVVDRCGACGEELFHQRADDFPPYLVIVLATFRRKIEISGRCGQ